MRVIVFNILTSTCTQKIESLSLKIGYLFSDKLVTASDFIYTVLVEKNFSKASMKRRIELMDGFYKDSTDERIRYMIDSFKTAYKQFHGSKHKPTQVVVTYKALENQFNKLYLNYTNNVIYLIRTAGFMSLTNLMDAEIFFGYLINDKLENSIFIKSSTELEYGKHIREVTPIDVLTESMPHKGNGQDVIMLPVEFFNTSFAGEREYYEPTDEEAKNRNEIYIADCFEIPVLHEFSELELRNFRKYFAEPSTLFRKKMDEWLMLCKSTNDATERIQFFVDELMPATKSIMPAIEANDTLNFNLGTPNNPKITIRVSVGEAPYEHVWKFYQHNQVITQEALDKLLEMQQTNEKLQGRMPFIALSLSESTKNSVDKIIEKQPIHKEVLQTKKSISID